VAIRGQVDGVQLEASDAPPDSARTRGDSITLPRRSP
jgi:hypothetical protein